MAVNCMRIEARPEDVFQVLADPSTYEDWVVGCADIRAVDDEWPNPGARFHHTVGFGPLKVKDSTRVLEVERNRRLLIEARARPAGVAAVEFTLRPVQDGTEVCIKEEPMRGLARRIANPGLDFLIHVRNAETLRRLDKQVRERRRAASDSYCGLD